MYFVSNPEDLSNPKHKENLMNFMIDNCYICKHKGKAIYDKSLQVYLIKCPKCNREVAAENIIEAVSLWDTPKEQRVLH